MFIFIDYPNLLTNWIDFFKRNICTILPSQVINSYFTAFKDNFSFSKVHTRKPFTSIQCGVK